MAENIGKRLEQKEPKQKKAKKPSRLTKGAEVAAGGGHRPGGGAAGRGGAGTACSSSRTCRETAPTPDGTQAGDGIDYGDGVQPRVSGERKSKDYYTVLILGRDTGGGGNTDTMLLASYDVTNQKATVMSIPRDTMVNVPWDIKRINSVYNYYGGGEKGIQALYKEISQLVGFEPDYQVIVEWEAVGKIVDAMGGVYFDVPRDMNYDDPYQDLSIHQTKGYRLLSGDDAMQVLRYRHDNRKNGKMLGYPDGDLGRIKTQQGLLKAMIEQLMSLKNITKVNEFIKVFNENVETDLSLPEYAVVRQAGIPGEQQRRQAGHRPGEFCDHAQHQRLLLEPGVSQLPVLCDAQRPGTAGAGEQRAEPLCGALHHERPGHHVRQ